MPNSMRNVTKACYRSLFCLVELTSSVNIHFPAK